MTFPVRDLFFIPFEQGADIAGASKGVDEIFSSLKIGDRLDSADSVAYLGRESLVKRRGDPAELEHVERGIADALSRGHEIFVVAGDHSITYYLYQVVSGHFDEALPLIVFDAHSDASREYDDWINQGCFIRELTKKVKPEIYHVGVRYDVIKLRDIGCLAFPPFSFLPGDTYVEEIIGDRIGGRRCYVSIDLDVLDPGEAPGVYFPVPGGISGDELHRMLKSIFSLNVVAADLVEYAPDRDPERRTLRHAVAIVEKWLGI